MATVARPRSSAKPRRTIRLALPPSEINPFFGVVIRVGKATDTYHVHPKPSDFGVAFDVEKMSGKEPATYQTLLDPAEGKHTCTCKGFCRWGHCRHTEGLMALRNAGKLDAPPVVCRVCRGSGADPLSDNLNCLPCSSCGGEGVA